METEFKNTNEVIQNSDVLYRSDIKWIEPQEPKPINDYEKEMLKNTRNPEEQLKYEAEEKPIEITEEVKRKQLITKIKVIALDKMGKAPLSNPSTFYKKEKEVLIKHMEELLNTPEDELTLLFNEICNDKIFTSVADYSTFAVYEKLT